MTGIDKQSGAASISKVSLEIKAGSADGDLVEIWDGATRIGTSTISDGAWSFDTPVLVEGRHTFEAKVKNVRSSTWTITVNTLRIDTSPMTLNGLAVMTGWRETGRDVPGNIQTRNPTGGTPPYTYTSSRPDIATVTVAGKVRGVGNGTAIITVVDANRASVSYSVNVSNVWRLVMSTGPFNGPQAVDWIRSMGGGHDSLDDVKRKMASMEIMYGLPFPIGQVHYWLLQLNPTAYSFYHWQQRWTYSATPNQGDVKGAWSFVRT